MVGGNFKCLTVEIDLLAWAKKYNYSISLHYISPTRTDAKTSHITTGLICAS